MLRADKAKKIISILNKIYPKTPIPLNHKNNFDFITMKIINVSTT